MKHFAPIVTSHPFFRIETYKNELYKSICKERNGNEIQREENDEERIVEKINGKKLRIKICL